MDSTNRIERLPGVGREAEHAPYIEALRRYLIERRYAGQTVHSYANCAGHFLRWTQGEQLDLVHIDEVAVARFADEHLTRCRCGWPTRTDRHEAHAAICSWCCARLASPRRGRSVQRPSTKNCAASTNTWITCADWRQGRGAPCCASCGSSFGGGSAIARS